MKSRILALVALTSLIGIAACDDDDNIVGIGNVATVRFVNATNVPLDVAIGGTVGTGNANLTFGQATGCLVLSSSNPDITIRNAGSTTTLPGFALTLQAGTKFTVVAIAGAGGAIQFAIIQDNFLPSGGQAGLSAVNAVSATAIDVFVTAPAATLGTPTIANVGFGLASAYTGVSSGIQQVRFTNVGTTTIVLNAGNTTFNTATNSVLVLGPAVAGGTLPRAFIAPGC